MIQKSQGANIQFSRVLMTKITHADSPSRPDGFAFTRSYSDSSSCSWSELSALPHLRTGRAGAGYKLVGHAEQVPQHIEFDARQANQHGGVADVVVRHVVNIGVRSEQFGAVIEIHANGKRGGFGRAIS